MHVTSISIGDEAAQPEVVPKLFEAAPEAMLVIDALGTIRLANPRAEDLFAYAPGALAGRSVDALVPAALAERHHGHRARYHAAPRRRPMGQDLELSGRRADGSECPIDVALGPLELGGEDLVVAIVRDVTDRKRHQDGLRYLSEHDALTGLLNRRGLDRQLAQALAHARCPHRRYLSLAAPICHDLSPGGPICHWSAGAGGRGMGPRHTASGAAGGHAGRRTCLRMSRSPPASPGLRGTEGMRRPPLSCHAVA